MRRHFIPLFMSFAALLVACTKAEPPVDPVRAVRTLVVAPAEMGGQMEFAAEVKARTESRLGFRVGGKLVRRWVNVGDTVQPGQVLAQLDPQDLKLSQDAAQANLVAAQANHVQLAADFKRFKELRDQGFISSADLERRETALKAALAQLDQARAQASVQGNQAGYATLVADARGVITGVDAEPGMVVAAGAPVVRLAHDGPRDAVFSVPEDKVSHIKAVAAQPGGVQIRPWAEQAAWPVSLREVAAAADPVTRTFLVKADLGRSAAAQALRLGQTATVLAYRPHTGGGYKLPLSALIEDKGKTAVWVLDPATMTVGLQAVELADAMGNDLIVTRGLKPGQLVVTAGVHVLNPGQKVKHYGAAFGQSAGPVAVAASAVTAAAATRSPASQTAPKTAPKAVAP